MMQRNSDEFNLMCAIRWQQILRVRQSYIALLGTYLLLWLLTFIHTY
jgi:hypothetical protein